MRLGVLDIGSRSVHLQIADLTPGSPPERVAAMKQQVRLAESTDRRGVIDQAAIRRVVGAVTEAGAVAGAHHVDDLAAYATSAIRDATNQEAVVAEIEAATGIHPNLMSGLEEARLTFLAARGWYGWSADRMLLLDIGGGSLEIASGGRCEPDAAISVPLGAGRLTHHHLPDTTPVKKREVKELRAYVRSMLSEATAELRDLPAPASHVATSKTFHQLARLTGSRKPKPGTIPSSTLSLDRLRPWIPRLAARTDAQRAKLRGISTARAHQALAGAVVAEAAMDVMGVRQLTICPWALREGVLLDRLHSLDGTDGTDDTAPRVAAVASAT